MTIIAVHGNMMLADSWGFTGAMGHTSPWPKIMRAPDGSLIGWAGTVENIKLARDWVARGMDWQNTPKVHDKDEDGALSGLILDANGQAWRISENYVFYEVPSPFAVGYETASTFWTGAVTCGANPILAMELAIKHCAYVGGDVQVERMRITDHHMVRRSVHGWGNE
jgi:hypothetical protein